MNNNPIVIESDSEGSVSSPLRRGMEFESHSISSIYEDFKPKIIPLIDNSEVESSFGESLSNEIPSMDSSESLFFGKLNRDENLVEKQMPRAILTEAEIEVAR